MHQSRSILKTLQLTVLCLVWVFPPSNAHAESANPKQTQAPSPCYPDHGTLLSREELRLSRDSAEIPEPLLKPQPVTPLGCDRPFLYRGELYPADSPQAQDALNLKFFVRDTPEAVELLDKYQNNRKKSQLGAYIGTAGLLIVILSPLLSNMFGAKSKANAQSAFRLGGLAVMGGGFFYGFTILRTNESNIPAAVDAYNQEHPEDSIELKFSTGWSF